MPRAAWGAAATGAAKRPAQARARTHSAIVTGAMTRYQERTPMFLLTQSTLPLSTSSIEASLQCPLLGKEIGRQEQVRLAGGRQPQTAPSPRLNYLTNRPLGTASEYQS